MSEELSEEFRALALSSSESQLEPSEEQIQLAKKILETIDLEHQRNIEKLKACVVTYDTGYYKSREEGKSDGEEGKSEEVKLDGEEGKSDGEEGKSEEVKLDGEEGKSDGEEGKSEEVKLDGEEGKSDGEEGKSEEVKLDGEEGKSDKDEKVEKEELESGKEKDNFFFLCGRKATAFLISDQGLMLTTNHSLPDISKELIYVIVTQERFEWEENHVQESIGAEGKFVGFGRVVLQDPVFDIALLVLDKSCKEELTKSNGFPFLQLSNDPHEEWTYADVIGYLSYYQTSVYTRGVISCANLPHATQGRMKFLSRTDATCSFGCSGSHVLFKLKVIGMHTEIANMDPVVEGQRLQFGGSLFLPVATIKKILVDNTTEMFECLYQLQSIGVI